jgi:hypothetical protein
MPPVFWFVVLPLALIAWWCFLMWVVSHMCGWKALARHYLAEEPFHGTRLRFRSARIGGGNYNSCLRVGGNSDGLWMSGMGPFRICHPPLFIPWVDITPRLTHHWLFGRWMDLAIAKTPNVRVRFPVAVAEELAAEANLSWEAS